MNGMNLTVSRYVHTLDYDDEHLIIWHSIFGRPMLISRDWREKFENDELDEDCIFKLRQAYFIKDRFEDEDRGVRDLFLTHNSDGCDKVKYLSLIMSEACNFRCKYCIHFANSEHQHNSEQLMRLSVATVGIQQYIDHIQANGESEAYINFGGGEPLLNWDVIKLLLPYIELLRSEADFPIRLGINTNLSLLTDEIAEKLVKYDVEVAASLDGLRDGNDLVRLSNELGGTYESIVRGFKMMWDAGRPLDGFSMTVTEDNFGDVSEEIIDFAESMGMSEVRIDIDVVGLVDIPTEEVVKRLTRVRKYAKAKGISVFGFWSRPAENMGLRPEYEDVGFCGAERGNSICVAPSGQVFPCGYSNYELCDYMEVWKVHETEPYRDLLKKRNLLTLTECQECPILGFCRGGCLVTKEANEESSEKVAKMCELYRMMTYEILRESIEDSLEGGEENEDENRN